MCCDYTRLGLLANLLVFGGVALLAQTRGTTATVVATAVIAAGVVLFGVFWRLQTRPLWRREIRRKPSRVEACEPTTVPPARD